MVSKIALVAVVSLVTLITMVASVAIIPMFTLVTLTTKLTHANIQTDMASPICVVFMHFVQGTHNFRYIQSRSTTHVCNRNFLNRVREKNM
jgi:hypothetical protein